MAERERNAACIADLTIEGQALLLQGPRSWLIALAVEQHAEVVEHQRDIRLIVDLPPQGQACVEERVGLFIVTLCERQVARAVESLGARGQGCPARAGKRLIDPAPSFGKMAASVPEAPERAGDPEARLG